MQHTQGISYLYVSLFTVGIRQCLLDLAKFQTQNSVQNLKSFGLQLQSDIHYTTTLIRLSPPRIRLNFAYIATVSFTVFSYLVYA